MKKLFLIAIVLAVVYFEADERGFIPPLPGESASRISGFAAVDTLSSPDEVIAEAFANHRSNFQIQSSGEVTRTLADDNDGDRHQRFIVMLASGQTLLIAHNIDLAERIASLKAGDRIDFNGEYEWNREGGVIHWTHRDPNGRHESGWLRHGGRTYQ